MSSINFEIDKSRKDSFYHFIKTGASGNLILKKNGKPDTGWALYSQLKTNEEKAAWIKAVNVFNSVNNIKTPSKAIKELVQKCKESISIDNTKFPDKQSYLMPALGTALGMVSASSDALCNENFVESLLQATGGVIPTKENIAKYALEAAKVNLEIDFHVLLNSAEKLGVLTLVTPVLDKIEELACVHFQKVDALYDEYSRLAAGVIRLYRKYQDEYGLTSSERERRKLQFLEKLAACTAEMREIVIEILAVDTLRQLAEMVKNVKTLSAEVWKSIIQKLKDIKDLFSSSQFNAENKTEIVSALNSLLFSLGGLLGAVFTMICTAEKEIDNSVHSLCKAEKVSNAAELIAKTQSDINSYNDEISKYTTIYDKAVNNKDGYSLYKNTSIPSNTPVSSADSDNPLSEDDYPCKVSMCEHIDDTDTSEWYNIFDYPEFVIVEIDLRRKFSWKIHVGSHIKLNDTICEIENTPVHSIFSADVIELGSNYFIGKYISDEGLSNSALSYTDDSISAVSDMTVNLINEKIRDVKDSSYDKIIDKYRKYAYAADFIKDYISFYRFPELALYTREHAAANAMAVSTDDFIEKYENSAQKILDDYHSNVKNACKKKNIKKYAKQGKILSFKKLLDAKKNKCLEDILTLYDNNPGQMKYCSKGRITDFYLYSHYIEYINSDRFNYDEENPYIVKLSDKINEFIGIRTRLELNKDNLDGLVYAFNELCDHTIKQYWKYTDIDYYTKLSELFKYDMYTNTDVISEGTADDSISLYRRVLNYLKSISKFSEDDQNNNVDNAAIANNIQGFLDKQDSVEAKLDENKEKFLKSLKKISYRFASLRKIELSLNNTNITTYADNDIAQQFEELRLSKGEVVNEYTEHTKYKSTDALYAKESILGPYIQMMKKITMNEVSELKSLYKDAVQFYLSNKPSIDSCEDLFAFREISWPAEGTIYKDNKLSHYYYFGNNAVVPPKSLDDLEKYEADAAVPEEYADDIKNMMSTPNTAYGIDHIAYWLRYCGVASLVNAMTPIYWAAGLNITGPIPLPIVYLPITPITVGSMVIVVGLGICGIAVWPMILFVNTGPSNESVLIPINLAINYVKTQVEKIKVAQSAAIKETVDPLVRALDADINKCIEEQQEIEYQMAEVKRISSDYNTNLNINKVLRKDTTSKATSASDKLAAANPVPDMILLQYGANAISETSEDRQQARMQEDIKAVREQIDSSEQENILSIASLQDKQARVVSEIITNTPEVSYVSVDIPVNIIKSHSSNVHTTYFRNGRKIEYLVIHYTAGVTSKAGAAANACAGWAQGAEFYEIKKDPVTGKETRIGYYWNYKHEKIQERLTSCDFAVDDSTMCQYNPDLRHYATWHSGGKYSSKGGSMRNKITNANSIGIEICSSHKLNKITVPNDPNYYFTDAVLANARALAKYIMKAYNIPIQNVYRHYDSAGKLCPGIVGWNLDSGDESKWIEFKESLMH